MNTMLICVKTQFEGIHCYPDAPEEVAYLRNPHRHMFHVEAEIEVFHDDRELEFIMVKHKMDQFLNDRPDLKNLSCEMIARTLQAYLKECYPVSAPVEYWRGVNIKISEDGENGVYLREV